MKSSYKKGKELETEFAEFMKRNLGYTKTSFDEHGIDPTVRQSGYQIDIHGEKENKHQLRKYHQAIEKSEEHEKKSKTYLIVFIIFIVYTVFVSNDIDNFLDSFLGDIIPELAGYGGIIFLAIFGFSSYQNMQKAKEEELEQKAILKRLTEYTWVECKNIKVNVKRDYITKLNNSFKRNNQEVSNKKKKRKNDRIYKKAFFVTKKGYSPDAKDLAREFKITCYVKDEEKGFIKVK